MGERLFRVAAVTVRTQSLYGGADLKMTTKTRFPSLSLSLYYVISRGSMYLTIVSLTPRMAPLRSEFE